MPRVSLNVPWYVTDAIRERKVGPWFCKELFTQRMASAACNISVSADCKYASSFIRQSPLVIVTTNIYPGMDTLSQLVVERPVVIFSKSSCCMSHSMKQLISSYGANPMVYELDEILNGWEVEKALKKLGCQPSVPAIFIGQRFIGGANDVISLQVQGKLVPLLMEAGAIWVWNTTN